MRIAVVGNSHSAMLVPAWERLRGEHDGLSLTFFAATRHGVTHGLDVVGSTITARSEVAAKSFALTSRGSETIDLKQFDGLLIAGLLRDVRGLVRLHAKFRAESHATPAGNQTLVSDDLFLAMARAERDASLAVTLARAVTAKHRLPVVAISHPYPSVDITVDGPPLWRRLLASGDAPVLHQTFVEVNSEVEPLWRILPQDASTMQGPLFTQRQYTSRTGFGPNSLARGEDHFHMNADFGQIALAAALHELEDRVDCV